MATIHTNLQFLHDVNMLIKKDGKEAVEIGLNKTLVLVLKDTIRARKKDIARVLEVCSEGMRERRKKRKY